jgi:WhiB family transcriptional regulator, redox-sensing transcriptional regulator
MPAWLLPEAWQADALCNEYSAHADWWFPPPGIPTKPARRVCERCLVRNECLAFAVDHHILDGVWGGTTGQERRRLWQDGWTGELIETIALTAQRVSRRP